MQESYQQAFNNMGVFNQENTSKSIAFSVMHNNVQHIIIGTHEEWTLFFLADSLEIESTLPN